MTVALRVTVAAAASMARTLNAKVPVADTLPETTPPTERLSPLGSDPVARCQLYGGSPPLACSVTGAYASPTSPLWNAMLEMARGTVGLGALEGLELGS